MSIEYEKKGTLPEKRCFDEEGLTEFIRGISHVAEKAQLVGKVQLGREKESNMKKKERFVERTNTSIFRRKIGP